MLAPFVYAEIGTPAETVFYPRLPTIDGSAYLGLLRNPNGATPAAPRVPGDAHDPQELTYAGFSSLDDFVNEVTTNGKTNRYDWNKITGARPTPLGAGTTCPRSTATRPRTHGPAPPSQRVAPDDTSGFGMYHGGNVSTDLKSIINIAALATAATGVPSILMLVDCRLVPPRHRHELGHPADAQQHDHPDPLHDRGGLRSFVVAASTSGATAHNLDNGGGTGTEYVDQDGNTAVHPGTIAFTASAITPHISHSGTATNNYGPFLPLASGDYGVRKYNYFKLSAASASASTARLCIVKPLASSRSRPSRSCRARPDEPACPRSREWWTARASIPLLYAGAAVAASSNFYGSIETAWG